MPPRNFWFSDVTSGAIWELKMRANGLPIKASERGIIAKGVAKKEGHDIIIHTNVIQCHRFESISGLELLGNL